MNLDDRLQEQSEQVKVGSGGERRIYGRCLCRGGTVYGLLGRPFDSCSLGSLWTCSLSSLGLVLGIVASCQTTQISSGFIFSGRLR